MASAPGSLFIVGSVPQSAISNAGPILKLFVPHLHSTLTRVLRARAGGSSHDRRPAQRGVIGTPLTSRELQIFEWVKIGKSNREIAIILGVSDGTVKNHTHSILVKMRVSTRAQAVAIALSAGYLSLPRTASEPMPRRLRKSKNYARNPLAYRPKGLYQFRFDRVIISVTASSFVSLLFNLTLERKTK